MYLQRIAKPRRIGTLTVTLHRWRRARPCPICAQKSRIVVTATLPSGTAYAYCSACWVVTAVAYARWARRRRKDLVSAP